MKQYKAFSFALLTGILFLISVPSCIKEKTENQEVGYLNVNPADLPSLYQLAYNGQTNLIKQLLEEQPGITDNSANIIECLNGAICAGNKDLVKYLLAIAPTGINLNKNSTENWYYSPFYYACMSGNKDIIALLLKYGANIKEDTSDSFSTPLNLAVESGDIASVRFLLKKGADLNAGYAPPLYVAVERGDKEMIRLLLKQGADVNQRVTTQGSYTYDGNTCLCVAVENKDTETVRFLLSKGADPDKRGKGEWAPLHHATNKGDKEMIELLINYGADINALLNHTFGNLAPLWIAVHSGNMASVSFLLEQGADKQHDPSLLLAAAYSGNQEMFYFLLDQVDPPTEQDRNKMWEAALKSNNLEVVKYLLETGEIDLNKKIGPYPRLPLELVAQNTSLKGEQAEINSQLLSYLIEKGAKPQLINDGYVMEWIIRNSNPETFDYFLDLGFSFPIQTDFPFYPYSSFMESFMNTIDWGDFYPHAAHYLLQQQESEPSVYSEFFYPVIVYYANDIRLQYPVMEFLVEEKVNPSHHPQAFLRCVYYNDFESVALFLRNGVDINSQNKEGQNALWYVSDPEMAEYLIRRGIDVSIPLVHKEKLIDISVLSVFAKYGISIKLSQQYLDQALRAAAHIGNATMVDYFLTRGANVNAQEEKTPLMENASKGYLRPTFQADRKQIKVSPKVTKQLIKAGADIDAEDENGDTALMHAIRHYEYDDEYLERDSSIRERYTYPSQNYSLIVLELLKAGANVNKVNKKGETPLSLAIKHDRTDLVPVLKEYGAEK